MANLADLRKDYSLTGLSEKDLARDPFRQFDRWYQEAEAARLPEPNAMVLATAARDTVEFWQSRRNRLHDRLRYRRDPDREWIVEQLSP